MKKIALTLAAAATLLSLPAAAQFQKPEDAIKYRQAAFTLMGNHFGRIAAMAQGKAPFDAKAAAENASLLVSLSRLPVAAKAEIWKDGAKFKAAAEKLTSEIAKLDTAAKTGSLDAIKAAVGGVGGACKGCHDDFRAERHSGG